MQRIEVQHHTPEQVRDVIAQAIEIADECFEDGHKWQPVFIQACQMLAAKTVQAVAPAQGMFVPPLG